MGRYLFHRTVRNTVPLLFPEPPSSFTKCFTEHLSMLATHYARHAAEHPLGQTFRPHETEMPHEVFAVPLAELRKGADVSNAASEGWRLFLREAPPVRVAEVDRSLEDDSLLFLGLAIGPQTDYTRRLLVELNTDPGLEVASYTVRLLRVKPLYLSCLWLSPGRSQDDAFLPLPPAFPPFRRDARYNREELTRLLQAAALQQSANTQVLFAE